MSKSGRLRHITPCLSFFGGFSSCHGSLFVSEHNRDINKLDGSSPCDYPRVSDAICHSSGAPAEVFTVYTNLTSPSGLSREACGT